MELDLNRTIPEAFNFFVSCWNYQDIKFSFKYDFIAVPDNLQI